MQAQNVQPNSRWFVQELEQRFYRVTQEHVPWMETEKQLVCNELRLNVTTIIRQLLNDQSSDQYTCGGTSGWRRVSFISMTNTSTNCPPELTLTSYSRRTCEPFSAAIGCYPTTCYPTTFSVGTNYSRVYGRVIGYQYAFTSWYSRSSNDLQLLLNWSLFDSWCRWWMSTHMKFHSWTEPSL